MKLLELKGKMFKLSDLQGLIKENAVDERKYDAFFEKYPQFKDPNITYQNSEELRKALYDYFGESGKFPDPNLYSTFNNEKRKAINKIFKMARGYTPVSDREVAVSDNNVISNNDPTLPSVSTANVGKENNNTAVNVLYRAFQSLGGENISPSDSNYVEEINTITNKVGGQYGSLIRGFNEKQFIQNPNIRVGDETNPFALFLFFYYERFCTKNGRGVSRRTEEFLSNISSEKLRDYIKEFFDLKPHNPVGAIENALAEIGLSYNSPLTNESLNLLINRYFNWDNPDQMSNDLSLLAKTKYVDTVNASMVKSNGTIGNVFLGALYIIKCSTKTMANFWNNLNSTDLAGDSLNSVRAGAYFTKYRLLNPETLKSDFLVTLSECFNIPITTLFDPVADVNDSVIYNGIKDWMVTFSEQSDSLSKFDFPVIMEKTQDMAPIERIFSIGRTLGNLMQEKFSKRFGVAGRNVLDNPEMPIIKKINLFLSDANEGLKLLEEDVHRRGIEMPHPINRLRILYNSADGVKEKNMGFWQLLAKNSNTKTQDEIFYYLTSISDPEVVWRTEYNRYKPEENERAEGGLGGKSIDILGRTSATKRNAKTLCFEYQGEQHYRPINIKPVDYQYSLFTQMRDTILTKCGFYSIKGRDGRTYYWADKDYGSREISPEAKNIIISVYSEYIEKLKNILRDREELGNSVISKNFNVVAEGSSVRSGTNSEALKTFTIREALKYFETVVERGVEDSDMFDDVPLNGMVPYLCSPCRFADEILTAVDLARDRMKAQTILSRKMYGWEMAYVTPKISKTFTEDDFRYTIEELAQNNDQVVFSWDEEGKKKIADYLVTMGFRTPTENKEESLFEQIVREIMCDNTL